MHIELKFDWNEIVNKKDDSGKLDVPALILLLLKEGRIAGKTKLQKEVFLAWNEVLGKEFAEDPEFRPHHFGPFSELVQNVHLNLKYEGKVKVASKGEGHMTSYITKNGIGQLEQALSNVHIPEEKMELLRRKKADWDEWTTKGIMRYIYRNYKEYEKKAKIRELIWESP